MSGTAKPSIFWLKMTLRQRGVTMRKLAEQVGVTRKHLSLCLHGHCMGGGYWARVRACVMQREWDLFLKLPHVAAWERAARNAAEDAAEVGGSWAPFAVRWVCGDCGTGLGFRASGVNTPVGETFDGLCPRCFALRKAGAAA